MLGLDVRAGRAPPTGARENTRGNRIPQKTTEPSRRAYIRVFTGAHGNQRSH